MHPRTTIARFDFVSVSSVGSQMGTLNLQFRILNFVDQELYVLLLREIIKNTRHFFYSLAASSYRNVLTVDSFYSLLTTTTILNVGSCVVGGIVLDMPLVHTWYTIYPAPLNLLH